MLLEVKKKIEEEEKQKKEQEAKEREEKERQEKEAKEKEAEEKKGEEGQAEEKPKEEEHVEPVEEPIHPVDDEESEEDSYDDEDDHDRGKLSSGIPSLFFFISLHWSCENSSYFFQSASLISISAMDSKRDYQYYSNSFRISFWEREILY